jgi:hypothetical protein
MDDEEVCEFLGLMLTAQTMLTTVISQLTKRWLFDAFDLTWSGNISEREAHRKKLEDKLDDMDEELGNFISGMGMFTKFIAQRTSRWILFSASWIL